MRTQHIALWDATKPVLRGKLITSDAYIRKEKRSKIDSLSFHVRKLENKSQSKQKEKNKN